MKPGALIFGLIFLGIWTLTVGGADALAVYRYIRSAEAAKWPTAAGVVTASGLTSHTTGPGAGRSRVYAAAVEYEFTVNGVTHTGDRVRFASFFSTRRGSGQSDAAMYPVGKAVRVYYNPADPADNVLQAGVGGRDRYTLMFLLPFTVLLSAMWVYGWFAWRGGVGSFPRVLEETVTVVRLNVLPAALVGFIGALAVSVAALFIFGFFRDGKASRGELMGVAAGTLGMYIAVGGWFGQRVRSGAYDLVIDPFREVVRLPRALRKKGDPAEAGFAELKAVEVRKSETTKVNNRAVNDVVMVLTGEGDGSGERVVRLRSWADGKVAREFCVWVRGKVGM